MAAALRPGGVAPVAEALAAGALEALGPRDEGQRAPDPGALAVGAAVGAVGHVLEGEAFHVGPRLEQPALRVLEAPEPGLEVVDELQRPEHQPVALLQAPRPPGQGLRELAADRGRPDDLEVPGRKLGVVPVKDVTFHRGLALQVQARHLPAQGLEGPADAPVPDGSSGSSQGLATSQSVATTPASSRAAQRNSPKVAGLRRPHLLQRENRKHERAASGDAAREHPDQRQGRKVPAASRRGRRPADLEERVLEGAVEPVKLRRPRGRACVRVLGAGQGRKGVFPGGGGPGRRPALGALEPRPAHLREVPPASRREAAHGLGAEGEHPGHRVSQAQAALGEGAAVGPGRRGDPPLQAARGAPAGLAHELAVRRARRDHGRDAPAAGAAQAVLSLLMR